MRDALWFMNNRVDVLLSSRESGDGLCVMDVHAPFDEAPPLHVHDDQDELFYVLEGRIRFQRGEERLSAGAGELVVLPQGVPHGFRVVSPEGARFLVTTRGEAFEGMVREVSRAAGEGLPPAAAPSEALQARLDAACRARGIALLGPPIS